MRDLVQVRREARFRLLRMLEAEFHLPGDLLHPAAEGQRHELIAELEAGVDAHDLGHGIHDGFFHGVLVVGVEVLEGVLLHDFEDRIPLLAGGDVGFVSCHFDVHLLSSFLAHYINPFLSFRLGAFIGEN